MNKNTLMKYSLSCIIAIMCILSAKSQNKMSQELLWKLGRVSGEAVSSDGSLLIYGVTRYDLESNQGNRNLHVLDMKSGESTQLTQMSGSEYNAVFLNGDKTVGFLNGGTWFEVPVAGGLPKQLDESGIKRSNVKLNSAGTHAIYTSQVKTGKTTSDRYPELTKADAYIYDELMYRHWDHWSDDMSSHIFVGQYKGGTISGEIDLMEGEPYDTPMQPFGGSDDLTWSPDGQHIAYVSKKMPNNAYATSTNSDIYLYDVALMETRNVTEGMTGYDMHPSWSPDGKWLTFTSMDEDGYESDKNDIVLMNIESGQTYNLTEGWDNTVSSYVWGTSGNSIYFTAAVNATYQVFEITVNNNPSKNSASDIRAISSGNHNINQIIGETKNSIIVSKQDMNHASELFSLAKKDGELTQLTHVNDPIYENLSLSKIEKRTIQTTDGKDMLTWVIYPPDFDPKKTYPTLLYCQGGPQSAVSQFYSFRWNFQLMAAKGYIIVAPNRRGLPSFGVAWNEAISGDWGGQPIKDYLSAIDEVSEEPYADEDRLGAVGASYGGYSVYMLAGVHQNRFKTFISHCGLYNLESWYGSTEELFFANKDIGGPYWMSSPPKSYELFSPHKFAQNWNTPMLVIHGGKDFRVPYTQGLEAYQAAQLNNVKSRLLFFPNEGHWVLSPQNGLIWHSEFFKWLEETL